MIEKAILTIIIVNARSGAGLWLWVFAVEGRILLSIVRDKIEEVDKLRTIHITIISNL